MTRAEIETDIERRGLVEYLIVLPPILVIVVGIVVFKAFDATHLLADPVWVGYSIVVATYLLSRFAIAMSYRPITVTDPRPAIRPSVAIVIPAMNEEGVIERTIRSCAEARYPEDLLEIVAIDDGSTDSTGEIMERLAEEYDHLRVVRFPVNQGKREGLAKGIELTNSEILVFVDSDSNIAEDALERMVQYFAYREVGAVSGNADVANRHENLLTKMQAVRYYVAFNVVKGAEAKFNAVTCCSGCFSAYRRDAIEAIKPEWLSQSFLGTKSTYGDDRSLTNFVLREGWKVLFAPDARSSTVVPNQLRGFLRQQLRWKKSWIRETIQAAKFMWRKHPVASASFYASIALTLLAPHVIFRALFIRPAALLIVPYFYLLGVAAMSLLYGLYYRYHRRDALWKYGVLFALFYTAVLVWQLPWAIWNLTDTRWGTRSA